MKVLQQGKIIRDHLNVQIYKTKTNKKNTHTKF